MRSELIRSLPRTRTTLIRGQEMVLLDKGTGRLMEMTKLQGGLHQAIEAKEHVKLSLKPEPWLQSPTRVSLRCSSAKSQV